MEKVVVSPDDYSPYVHELREYIRLYNDMMDLRIQTDGKKKTTRIMNDASSDLYKQSNRAEKCAHTLRKVNKVMILNLYEDAGRPAPKNLVPRGWSY